MDPRKLEAPLPERARSTRIDDIARECKAEKRRFFSLEFFPPRTEAGIVNLQERIMRLAQFQPAFVDFTWTAGGKSGKLSIELARFSVQQGLVAQLHLSVAGMEEADVRTALDTARDAGIVNILALRGDLPASSDREPEATVQPFPHAVDLVRFIRAHYGDTFCIGVAGYPEGHVDASSYEDDLAHLKAKIDAGASYVLTQQFFNLDRFETFLADCARVQIAVPIIPGLMPIHNYESFSRIVRFCRTDVPKEVTAGLAPIRTDDDAVKVYGSRLAFEMSERLFQLGHYGVHFYTLNLEQLVTEVLLRHDFSKQASTRAVPWQHARAADDKHAHAESVRPIFWANRPQSYVSRTSHWDEFPNGRWGDRRSPAFGEQGLSHLTKLHALTSSERRAVWGHELNSVADVCSTFVRYVTGQIPILPWCEVALSSESRLIVESLALFNSCGMLTINSQPAVDGAPSDDPDVGWGGAGGYVYQKAYMEMFVSKPTLDAIVERMRAHPSLSYLSQDVQSRCRHNLPQDESGGIVGNVCAVTWGVFPGKEIVQPTVVDSEAFVQWKDEAFELWRSQWASLYAPGSRSREVLESIHDSWFLLNVVDHNYKSGAIFTIFREVAEAIGPMTSATS